MFVRVGEQFETRFNELDFVLSNYDLIEELGKPETVIDVTSKQAAISVIRGLKDIIDSPKHVIEKDTIHTELLSSGIKHTSTLTIFAKTFKVKDLLDLYTSARHNAFLLAVYVAGKRLDELTAAGLVNDLGRVASVEGLSSSLFKELLTGIGGKSMNAVQEMLNKLVYDKT